MPFRTAGLLALFSTLFFLSAPAFPQAGGKPDKKGQGPKKSEKKTSEEKEKKKKDSFELKVQGVLGAAAKGGGDFYEFTYTDEGGKKPVKKKAWVKIDSSSAILRDRSVPVDSFKEG